MLKLKHPAAGLAALLFIIPTASALAQATRTWVSGVGDDVNPCSRTAPCKTFAGAISKTAAGGEIDVIDPGGFGTITITKAITIDGAGTQASILASGTNGINVNAGPNDVVILRNLSINGAGTTLGLNGVNYLAGAAVNVENCVIFNFSQSAISAAPSNAGNINIINTSIMSANNGILLSSANGGAVQGLADHVTIRNVTTGINATGSILFTVANSAISNTTSTAINSGTGVGLNVDSSSIVHNNGPAITAAGGFVRISRNIIYGNASNYSTSAGGTVVSAGNNSISGTSTVGGSITQQ
jgi:hypothetical protein